MIINTKYGILLKKQAFTDENSDELETPVLTVYCSKIGEPYQDIRTY